MDLDQALWQHFHLHSFRPLQKEIITSILEGTDTLAVLPTGTGKSLCFQLPAVMLPGVTLVISPLIALMHDQVTQLQTRSIPSVQLSSMLSPDQLNAELFAIESGVYKLIYLSPERLQNTRIQKVLQSVHFSLVVIDEAHCISSWGHEFRPEYREINTALKCLSSRPPILALTATATSETIADICQVLNLQNPTIWGGAVERKNLHISVIKIANAEEQDCAIAALVNAYAENQIVLFTATRAKAEELAGILTAWLPNCTALSVFHAKLTKEEKMNVAARFRSGQLKVIVATTAFGMGLDFPHIRCVVHVQIPGSFAQYYQEIGRAGRDGQRADCYLLYNKADIEIQSALQKKLSPTPKRTREMQNELRRLRHYCEQEMTCRQSYISQYFGQKQTKVCGQCDICLSKLTRKRLTLAQKLHIPADITVKIKSLRLELAQKYDVHHTAIAHDMQLLWLLSTQPQQPTQLLRLPGFGAGWIQRWAGQFLAAMIK